MIRNTMACILTLMVFSCILNGSAYAGNSAAVIDAGSLQINVISSETASLFYIVDQLSRNNDSQYTEYFNKLDGGLNQEDQKLLAQHASLRKQHDWSLNEIFYTTDDLDSALSKAVKKNQITEQEAQIEKRVLMRFKARVDKLAKQENQTITALQNELSAKKPEIRAFAEAISKLFGDSRQEIQVYVIPNPNHDTVGGGWSNDIFMLMTGDARKQYEWLLQEVVLSHAYQQNAVAAAVRPEAGLDQTTLIHGIAHALVPGIFHKDGSDPLVETVADLEANGASLKDYYARFNMYGLALRPLLKEALYDKPQTIKEILPRAVDAWLVLAELEKARSTERATQSSGEHDYKKDKKHSIFVFGSYDTKLFTEDLRKSTDKHLFGRNHSAEMYKDMLTKYSKPDDTIILLVSLDQKERVPSEFSDLLPMPWTKVEKNLKQGQIVIEQGHAREMTIFLIAAPTSDQMCKEFKRLIGEKKF